jgi:hypothetical protein
MDIDQLLDEICIDVDFVPVIMYLDCCLIPPVLHQRKQRIDLVVKPPGLSLTELPEEGK